MNECATPLAVELLVYAFALFVAVAAVLMVCLGYRELKR